MIPLKYVGIHDRVEVPAADLFAEQGETVQVPDEVAGRVPKGDPDDEDYDPGEGLLAQPDNWQPVKVASRKKED